ncbi:hypothetical protein [Pseudomonas sp. SJZ079]|uniref:hypothetical protein n=1 Tax=Pseudomonas sp. SJZ079 TaxID=2572887 RepID=UPI0011BDFD5E|nr:hypothetical protein [Pseudomonas sp. SJZ079]
MGDVKFCPDISGITSIEFRPYMVESAYDYYMICTTSPHQRMGIQTVMCALAIEILLKSFHAKVTGNHGQLNETYEFSKKEALPKQANAHDLIVLYHALPEKIKNFLLDSVDLEILATNKDLFTHGRYIYESSANKTHNNDIIKLAACLICKVVFLYKQLGCVDPFIIPFDIEKLYFSQVQLLFECSAP